MSVKRLEAEYGAVAAQYQEMLNDLKDMEKELAEGLVPPEFVENLRKMIAPIKDNYEQWSYIMFLLHEPQRKAKREKYRKQMQSKLTGLDMKNSPEARIAEGKHVLESLKEVQA